MSRETTHTADETGNPDESKSSDGDSGRFGRLATIGICFLILAGTAALLAVIFSTEPEVKRIKAKRQSAMLVDVLEVSRSNHNPLLLSMGTVRPAQDIVLSPRVSGQLIEMATGFTPGGIVKKGEVLLRLDPADFTNALQQRINDESQARADLDIEMGRQTVAKKGYDLLDARLFGENSDLILRKPQLAKARAVMESAKSAVEQARLELERAEITAPFDAQVLSRNVNVGSQVSPSAELGRLVGVKTYWVEATVPVSRLPWLSFAKDGNGTVVQIRNQSGWPAGVFREGKLDRLIGSLDGRSRLARVLITVEDPLLQKQPDSDKPPLLIGSFVEASIPLRELENVVRLNRDHVRREDTVWVMKDQKLDIREAEIVYRDSEYAYIRSGLEDGDTVVTSNIATVVQGARLRLKAEEKIEVDAAAREL